MSFINEIFKNSKVQKLSRGIFCIKNYIVKFLISENKNKTPDTYYYRNNDYAMLKRLKAYIKFDTEQGENTKSSERQKKLVFQKNW